MADEPSILTGINDLSSFLDSSKNSSSSPLELALTDIDEDPNQPRRADNPGFGKESLKELAATIKLRGVKTPISVRENPEIAGRFIINHGARRFRASLLAETATIPAYVDNDYTEDDQIIENMQRNDLTAREIANFIDRQLKVGRKKAEIARALGKSAGYVTQHLALLDLPDVVAGAFNSGRLNDISLVGELIKLLEKHPEISDWIADPDREITKRTLKEVKQVLSVQKEEKPEAEPEEHSPDAFENSFTKDFQEGADTKVSSSEEAPAEIPTDFSGFSDFSTDNDFLSSSDENTIQDEGEEKSQGLNFSNSEDSDKDEETEEKSVDQNFSDRDFTNLDVSTEIEENYGSETSLSSEEDEGRVRRKLETPALCEPETSWGPQKQPRVFAAYKNEQIEVLYKFDTKDEYLVRVRFIESGEIDIVEAEEISHVFFRFS